LNSSQSDAPSIGCPSPLKTLSSPQNRAKRHNLHKTNGEPGAKITT
jgi:hypothetical protein